MHFTRRPGIIPSQAVLDFTQIQARAEKFCAALVFAGFVRQLDALYRQWCTLLVQMCLLSLQHVLHPPDIANPRLIRDG